MSEVHFCNLCNESIPLAEIQSGAALRSGSRALCPLCRDLLRRQGGSSRRGGWFGVLLALLACAGVVYLSFENQDRRAELREAAENDAQQFAAMTRIGLSGREQIFTQLHQENTLLGSQVEILRNEAEEGRKDLAARIQALDARIQVLEQGVADLPGLRDRLAAAESALSVQDERQRSDRATQESLRDELARLSDRVQNLVQAAPKETNPEGFSPEVSKLLRQLQDDDPEIRYAALEKVQALQDDRLLPHIYPLLADPYEFTRFLAAHTFGDWGAKPAVPHLIEALHDEVGFVRDAAVRALRRITGQNFGFEQDAPEEARESAYRQWKTWWAANGDAFLSGS